MIFTCRHESTRVLNYASFTHMPTKHYAYTKHWLRTRTLLFFTSPILDPQSSILFLHPRFSIPDSRFLIFSILDSRSSILDSRSSILDSRSSILASRFSNFDSRFLILDARSSILDSRCSILDSRFSPEGPGIEIVQSRIFSIRIET